MLRRGLAGDSDPEVAEALLRYYARKSNSSDADQDKADYLVTYLYKNPRVLGQWERRGLGLDGSVPLPPFEIALMEILTDSEPPPLSEQAALLLCELDSLREQAEMLHDFSEVVDLALVRRGRHLKALLGEYFFHPAALAGMAVYNMTLGRKFETLFRSAAQEIRGAAQELQRAGGNPWTRLDGEVTVRDVAGLEEEEVLTDNYLIAQERFRTMIRLKKALTERVGRSASQTASASETRAAKADAGTRTHAIASYDPSREEARLLRVAESIRNFILAANPEMRSMVPMRSFNLVLTPAETDAFCSGDLGEDSIYGETARMLVRIVAVITRMGAEYGELRQKQNSKTLSGPHADALRFLVEVARQTAGSAEEVFLSAETQGVEHGAVAVLESLDRLRGRAAFLQEVLQGWRSLQPAEA
jgi:hypothetical protein